MERHVIYLTRRDDGGTDWIIRLTDEDLLSHGLEPSPETIIPDDHPLWDLPLSRGRPLRLAA